VGVGERWRVWQGGGGKVGVRALGVGGGWGGRLGVGGGLVVVGRSGRWWNQVNPLFCEGREELQRIVSGRNGTITVIHVQIGA